MVPPEAVGRRVKIMWRVIHIDRQVILVGCANGCKLVERMIMELKGRFKLEVDEVLD